MRSRSTVVPGRRSWSEPSRGHEPPLRRPASLAHDAINALFGDSDGSVWIATSNGLDEYDSARDAFRHNQNEPRDPYT